MQQEIDILGGSDGMACTENGAASLATTGSKVLNLFFKVVRNTPAETIHNIVSEAWDENPLLTIRAVFQLRDCRGGKGERRAFQECILWLIGNEHRDAMLMRRTVIKNLEHIPFYGTYKDLLNIFAGTEFEPPMIQYYASVLRNDIDLLNFEYNTCETTSISLAGKWAPSEKSSMDKKYGLAKKMAIVLAQDHVPVTTPVTNLRDYRTNVLSPLRKQIDIVESHMCGDTWEDIDYQRVPGVAMCLYRNAFAKHSESKFATYLDDVAKSRKHINAISVYPHQLVRHYMMGGELDVTIELQWKEIVKCTRARFCDANAIPLVDVSGSMTGEPMQVAIALGLLLSEITHERTRGKMLTFTESPALFSVDINTTLQQKVKHVMSMPWGGSTDISRVFVLMLRTAMKYELPTEAMPKTLYIFSDMQFDIASPTNAETNFEMIESMYTRNGYTRPNIVFWNLRGDTVDFPVSQHVPKSALVSGFSQSMMEMFLTGEVLSPYATMLAALNAPRYARITLAD